MWQQNEQHYKLMHEGRVEQMRLKKELEPFLKQCNPRKAAPHKRAMQQMFAEMNKFLPINQRVKIMLRKAKGSDSI